MALNFDLRVSCSVCRIFIFTMKTSTIILRLCQSCTLIEFSLNYHSSVIQSVFFALYPREISNISIGYLFDVLFNGFFPCLKKEQSKNKSSRR